MRPIPLHRRGGFDADGVVPNRFLITHNQVNVSWPSLPNLLDAILCFQDHPALTGTPPMEGNYNGLKI